MLPTLLAPFSWLYGAVMWFRNFIYDRGWRKSYSFKTPVITVGNLNVGGTGKTPMIEYLVRLLSYKYSVAILSRGYGRSTRGFRWANDNENASTIGDEPFQFYNKFKNQVNVFVCENRVEGINLALKNEPNIEIFLLDDAFQHRRVRPLFSILLTDFSKPFFKDFILPKGRLRESRSGCKRSDAIVVTKCPELNADLEKVFKDEIRKYAGEKDVFFTEINYGATVSTDESKMMNDIILVTGIADDRTLVNYVSNKFNLIRHYKFEDHHSYTLNEIKSIEEECLLKKACVVTTEKDFVKLISMPISKKLWFYLPIQSGFINNGSVFDKMVLEKIENHLDN